MMSIMIMSMSLSLMFMCLSHPVSLSIIIFIQTIVVSMLCGMMSNLFWFSYMLFLVMIGGLLILFLYMTNVASNEKFKPSKMVKMIITVTLIALMKFIFIDKFFIYYKTAIWMNNFKTISITPILMKFYNYPFNTIMITMMIFLLLTMIMTVKVTNLKEGALRQKH